MKSIFTFLLISFLGACTFSNINQENITTYDPTVDISHIEFDGGNGTSAEKAVVISKMRNEKECRASEFAYLKNRFGEPEKDWLILNQKSKKTGEATFDVLKIRDLKTDSLHILYFDISAFHKKS